MKIRIVWPIILGVLLATAACSRVVHHTRRSSSPGLDFARRGSGVGAPHQAPYAGNRIVRTAKRYLGVPYRFGGKSPATGFDCSGFTSYVYGRLGMSIARGARGQFRSLRPVRVPAPGDLVFFRTSGNRISHVGIYAGNLRFVHAPRTGKTVEVSDLRIRYWRDRYAGSRTARR